MIVKVIQTLYGSLTPFGAIHAFHRRTLSNAPIYRPDVIEFLKLDEKGQLDLLEEFIKVRRENL